MAVLVALIGAVLAGLYVISVKKLPAAWSELVPALMMVGWPRSKVRSVTTAPRLRGRLISSCRHRFRGGRDEANQKILKMYKNGNRLQASLNAYSEQYSENQAAELEEIAKVLSVPPTRFGFSCYDPVQSKSLKRLAGYLRSPPTLQIKSIQDYSGPNAAKVAIMSLWRWTIAGTTGTEMQDLQAIGLEEEYVSSKLRGNDFLALFLTILVDSGIFILTVSRPKRHFAMNQRPVLG